MNELVFRNANGDAVTTSYLVAETFGKKHQHVLRDIDTLECSEGLRASNFGLSFRIRELPNGGSKEERFYYIGKDGFTFLAMGYTGKKAAEFKEKYIAAFNAMEQQIRQGVQLSTEFMQTQMQMMNQMMQLCNGMMIRLEKLEDKTATPVQPSAPRYPLGSPAAVKASGGNMRRYRTPGHYTVPEASKELVSRGVFIFQTALYRYLREAGYLCCDDRSYNLPTEICLKNRWMVFVNSGTGLGKRHPNAKRRYFTPYLSQEFVDMLEKKFREMGCTDPGGYQLEIGFGKEVEQ